MHAVILAGGKGARLRPYTTVIPKPLMPIGDHPILEIIVRQLVYSGFSSITLTVNHQAELIKAFFGDGRKWNVAINYSFEEKPLGTIGPLKLLRDLPDNFLVMNGDLLTDLHYGEFLKNHSLSKSDLTVACIHKKFEMDFGVLESNSSGEITHFNEKPFFEFDVNMGIYAIARQVVGMVPAETFFGFDQLIDRLLKQDGIHPKLYLHQGYWLDIGKPRDYEQAIDDFKRVKSKLLRDE